MLSLVQLESMTSPGLVRRAQKSLDKTELLWESKQGDLWSYSFDNTKGQLNIKNLQQSHCDCPASGLCKHIVAAAISSMDASKDEAFVPVTFDLPNLFVEAGKAACRYAYSQWHQHWHNKFLQQGGNPSPPADISLEINPDHCLLSWGEQRSIIGSSGDLSSITIEHGDNRERLLAALLYTACRGEPVIWPEWVIGESELKKKHLNELEIKLKETLKKQLLVLVSRGFDSISPANLVELIATVPGLKSRGEVRLGNGIHSLAEWVERRNSKQGLDPSNQIVRQIVNLYAQCESSRQSIIPEVEEFESLNLLCLGGHQWVSNSGALGLTMVFLADNGQIFSASLMRNQKGNGFNLQQAWSMQNLWSGSPMNNQFSGQYFHLNQARLNHWQSLSLSSKTEFHADKQGSFNWQSITDWQQLKSVDEYGYALLSVKRWLNCDFNEVTQELVIQLQDEHNQLLLVRQKYSANSENRITNLLQYWVQQAEYLLVRYTPIENEHIFEPIALYHKKWMSLDFMKTEKARMSLLTRLVNKFKTSEVAKPTDDDDLMSLLSMLEDKLTSYPYCDREQLNLISQRFESLGLTTLSEKINRIDDAEQFLQLIYCVGVMKKKNANWPVYSL